MIKFTGDSEDGKRKVLGIGLSDGNLRLLREGKPIMIWGEEMRLPFDVLVFWGKTDEALAESVKAGVGPNTVVHDYLTSRPKKN